MSQQPLRRSLSPVPSAAAVSSAVRFGVKLPIGTGRGGADIFEMFKICLLSKRGTGDGETDAQVGSEACLLIVHGIANKALKAG